MRNAKIAGADRNDVHPTPAPSFWPGAIDLLAPNPLRLEVLRNQLLLRPEHAGRLHLAAAGKALTPILITATGI